MLALYVLPLDGGVERYGVLRPGGFEHFHFTYVRSPPPSQDPGETLRGPIDLGRWAELS